MRYAPRKLFKRLCTCCGKCFVIAKKDLYNRSIARCNECRTIDEFLQNAEREGVSE